MGYGIYANIGESGMSLKQLSMICISYIFLNLLLLWTFFDFTNLANINIVEVNDIIKTIEENWNSLDDNLISKTIHSPLEYFVLDNKGKHCYASAGIRQQEKNIMESIDLIVDNEQVGKIIFINNTYGLFQQSNTSLKILCTVIILLSTAGVFLYCYFFWNKAIKPFKQLESFAERIAQGNLEMPLSMDNNNILGSFTTSFDMMREELLLAKNKELMSSKRKKELIAALSHDIKTPISSIKAVAELLSVQEKNEKKRSHLNSIVEKADQVNLLTNNLLQSTLEELEELEVVPQAEASAIIADLLSASDYKKYLEPFYIPECLLYIDKIRLAQVFDNIINNSYKYANTKITVRCTFANGYLRVLIQDYGNSISAEDIALLTQKFYRGKNAVGITGSGLGLHISFNIMKKMGGNLTFQKNDTGFNVNIEIPLM